jgi:hypothetical protein
MKNKYDLIRYSVVHSNYNPDKEVGAELIIVFEPKNKNS